MGDSCQPLREPQSLRGFYLELIHPGSADLHRLTATAEGEVGEEDLVPPNMITSLPTARATDITERQDANFAL